MRWRKIPLLHLSIGRPISQSENSIFYKWMKQQNPNHAIKIKINSVWTKALYPYTLHHLSYHNSLFIEEFEARSEHLSVFISLCTLYFRFDVQHIIFKPRNKVNKSEKNQTKTLVNDWLFMSRLWWELVTLLSLLLVIAPKSHAAGCVFWPALCLNPQFSASF